MKLQMRRQNQEIKDIERIEAILQQAQVLHLGLSQGNFPYVVPVSFGYKDHHIYVHSAPEGQKLDILVENPHICFQVETGVEVISQGASCNWTLSYYSVIGFGVARLVQDPLGKSEALNVIVQHYGGEPCTYDAGKLERMAVIDIEVETMTCKFSHKKV